MKSKIYTKFYTLAFFVLSVTSVNAQLFINEFMASNNSSISDELGEFEDWIEIYNAGSSAVNLAGYYISDDLGEPTLWQISNSNANLTTVPAGGYLILWADKDTDDGANHIDIKLGAGGEDIVLVAPNGTTIVDQYTFDAQVTDVSYGRIGDGGNDWDFFTEPTPNAENDEEGGAPQVARPVASISGGFYTGTVSVSLSTTTPDAEIYYTTDGSHPTENSNLYTGTLSISSNTPLRAAGFLDPLTASEIITETYLFDIDHAFPVVAYTADPVEMFDPATGMYPNYEEDIEIIVNAEMFEPDGTLGFNQVIESEINGTGSAVSAQKSLALKAKSGLGSATIDHQIFPLSDRDEYRSLILRNSGQDNNITMFRDVMATSLFWDVTDINGNRPTIQEPEIFGQAYRPGVSYINGEYWGILNIRERTDKRYIRVHFGLDDDEVDYIENENEVKEGDIIEWDILENFLEENSLASESNFQFVDDRVDLSHYIDYLAFNIYIDNSDWPGNNIRRFKERVPDAQWRWLTYDLDFSFGLFVEGQPWNSGFNNANSLNRLLTLNGYNWPNPDYSTLLFRRLMENDAWRTRFINRMADQLNVMYTDDRVVSRIDDFEAVYTPEIQEHIDRWIGFLDWNDKIQVLRNFANGRTENVRNHFVSEIDDITGISDVTINLNNSNQGEVDLNTISVHQDNAPFTGKYFNGIDIPITAFPNRGYVLTSWSGSLSGNDPNETININSNTTITANFGLGSTSTSPIVINEINYNSSDDLNSDDWVELHNPNNFSVDISGWYFEDEGGSFFGMPANTIILAGGYLVLAESLEKFSDIYPQISNVIGDFGRDPRGFGLSGGGELITLKNANGELIDEVEYDDNSPWPEEADGDGPTLQLINPSLDNTLASSWQAILATPGAINGGSQGPLNQAINFPDISDQLTTNAPFSISANASSGLAVSFTIISGPASISGNTITLTGAPGTVTVQANQSGNTNWNPAPSVNRSFNVTTPPIGGDYCDAQGNEPWQEWVARVQLNDIDHASSKSQYSDFTAISTSLDAGGSYDITLTAGFSWAAYNEYFRVWIDYNQNGIFEEPSEIAFSGIVSGVENGSPSGSVSGAINIPGSAATGSTRMRIAMQREAYADPCGSFTIGEVEDYTVSIGAGNGTTLTVNNCPDNITQTASAGQNSTSVFWTAPTGSTTCPAGFVSVNQTAGPPSGNNFNVGTTTAISYLLSDQCGNIETCSFTITVNAANNGSVTLNCPPDITVTSQPGQNGATINWNNPTASTSCPSGGLNISQIGGAPNGSFFEVGNYQIAYSADDNCSNLESCTFNITVLAEPNGDYCESASDFPWHDYISNVQINTINNPSSKSMYSDFTNISTTLNPSMTYDIILTTSYSWATYDEYWNVWIDYNGNGLFEAPAELVYSGVLSAPSNGTESATLNGLITIPDNAVSGQTRMRVSMSRGNFADPCDVFDYGEVEDYTINIPGSLNGNGSQSFVRALSDIEIFPNPASDQITIILENEMDLKNIKVYNLASQRIFEMEGQKDEPVYQFDVKQWKEGMYFIQFNLENGRRVTKRFIVNSKL